MTQLPKWANSTRESYLVTLFLRSRGFCVFGHPKCTTPEHHYEIYIDNLIDIGKPTIGRKDKPTSKPNLRPDMPPMSGLILYRVDSAALLKIYITITSLNTTLRDWVSAA
jgi:hypothetical protein